MIVRFFLSGSSSFHLVESALHLIKLRLYFVK